MTLFEAIRELKEGQEIVDTTTGVFSGAKLVTFYHDGELAYPCCSYHLGMNVRIIDLPKPKMTLEEGLYQAAEAIPYELLENPSPLQLTKHFIDVLRSLPIDWPAEADRKEGE